MSVEVESGARAALVGQTVSHYEILRLLGRGGMGEVYEARDANLGRRVALKFLSSERAPSVQALQRLEREARAASALNHPRICTIYDIGEHEGDRFIAMELLDGEPLRARLQRGALDVPTLLHVGIEVAEALDAAHRARIVHRDVSPSNVFLTRDGHAKLVDFGLAKHEPGDEHTLVPPELVPTMSAEPKVTSEGAVVGTAAYMSPEQVRGDELDHRTDLFSFGAVLYEMATGRRAFRGKTSALVFDAILHADPPRARTVNPALPEGLQPILDKALDKDRHLRYHSADDLRTDLERLKRHLEGGDHPAPVPWRWSDILRAHRWLALGAAAAVLAVAALAIYIIRDREPPVPQVPARQVTSGRGVEGEPAVSPDGRTIAYTTDEAGDKDIWIVDVKGGPAQRLTTSEAEDSQPTWFPDGRSLAFTSDRRNRGHKDVWRAPVLDGSAATIVVPDAESPAISPDGATIAFVRNDASGYTRVAVAPVADPVNARVLTSERTGRWNHNEPAWSPDGTRICYSAWDGLWIVPLNGVGARHLTTEESDQHPTWSPDGRFVYAVSYVDRTARLWRITVASGVRQRVTLGSGAELWPDVSRDGHVLAFASESGNADLATIDLAAKREASFGTGSDDYWPSLGPDARVVYFGANRWGLHDIWRQHLLDARPVGPTEIVFEQPGDKTYPAVSPDGRWLAYYRFERLRGGRVRRDVWVVSTSGGTPTRVTTDEYGYSFHPAWSPDSSTLVYGSEQNGVQALWTRRVTDGKPLGTPHNVTAGWTRYTHFPAWSPDGSTIAFITRGEATGEEVALVPSGGGRPRVVPSGADAGFVRWDGRTGNLLVAGRWGGENYQVRAIRPDGSQVVDARFPLVLGKELETALFDLSPDGRFVVVSRGALVGHVWVMETRSRTF